MPDDTALLAVLESLRERGALGESSLPQAVSHAGAFVAALPPSTRRVLDLGSGGGLPGLVIAVRLPNLHVVLTDRRERRTDLLRMAVTRLGIADRVEVVTGDVSVLGRRKEYEAQFDAVTARAFGGPMWTLSCARPFLGVGGVVIVSDPPESDPSVRWPAAELGRLGLTRSTAAVAHTGSQVSRFWMALPA